MIHWLSPSSSTTHHPCPPYLGNSTTVHQQVGYSTVLAEVGVMALTPGAPRPFDARKVELIKEAILHQLFSVFAASARRSDDLRIVGRPLHAFSRYNITKDSFSSEKWWPSSGGKTRRLALGIQLAGPLADGVQEPSNYPESSIFEKIKHVPKTLDGHTAGFLTHRKYKRF